jgi:hypothetical protein
MTEFDREASRHAVARLVIQCLVERAARRVVRIAAKSF